MVELMTRLVSHLGLLANELKISRRVALALLHEAWEPVSHLCTVLPIFPAQAVGNQCVYRPEESLPVSILGQRATERSVREEALVLLRMLQYAHVICIELDRDGADDSLVTRLNNSEIISKLVYRLNSFAQIFHCDLLGVAIGSDLPEQRQAFILFEESSVLLAHGHANVYDLDLHIPVRTHAVVR